MNQLIKALNDPTRRAILELLKTKDLNAGEIASAFNSSKATISHHLDILRKANLVFSRKKAQQVVYSLNATILEELLSWLFSLKSNSSDQTLKQ